MWFIFFNGVIDGRKGALSGLKSVLDGRKGAFESSKPLNLGLEKGSTAGTAFILKISAKRYKKQCMDF
ncbi:MAG TPA: hypothetical protein ENK88_01975 [Campylobacterales bacterium]|nr:hypothetical protein [Campylobacterales bacterium]